MRFYSLILSLFLMTGSAYGESSLVGVSWVLGAHRGSQVSISERIMNSKTFYVLASSRNGHADTARIVTNETFKQIIYEWELLPIAKTSADRVSICGSPIFVEFSNSSGKKMNYYCSDSMLLDEKIRFKSFYEKLLSLATGSLSYF